MASLVTPPFRTPLTSDGAPNTTKDWWLFWDQIRSRTNSNSSLAGEGAHADRPVPDGMPDGAIYVESDRGVLYQNQGGVWQYVAGTMYGTLSPDQRPADLGVSDGGFQFCATDTANQGRQFVWTQTAWIETTPVLYGTHALRPAVAAAPARCLYVETDRGSVIYQNQGAYWQYLAGTMWGTLSPDQRPTDLGVHDAGFDFRTSVNPPREFIWSQTAWIETTAGGAYVYAAGSVSSLTLTTTPQDIPGLTLTLSRAGTYHVIGVFDLMLLGEASIYLFGQLVGPTGAVPSQQAILFNSAAGTRASVAQQWPVTASAAGQTIKAQAYKSGGTGSSLVTNASTLAAMWVSP